MKGLKVTRDEVYEAVTRDWTPTMDIISTLYESKGIPVNERINYLTPIAQVHVHLNYLEMVEQVVESRVKPIEETDPEILKKRDGHAVQEWRRIKGSKRVENEKESILTGLQNLLGLKPSLA